MLGHTIKVNAAHPNLRKCVSVSWEMGPSALLFCGCWWASLLCPAFSKHTFHYARQDLLGIKGNSIKQSGLPGPPTIKKSEALVPKAVSGTAA